MASITLHEINPRSTDDAEKYLELLSHARQFPEIRQLLPELFDDTTSEKRPDDVMRTLQVPGMMRYFICVDGKIGGRVELTDHLNDDPSVQDKFPAGVTLGLNTCYFLCPDAVGRSLSLAHQEVAVHSIYEAILRNTGDKAASPWLPVAEQNDTSMGWRMFGTLSPHLSEQAFRQAATFTVHEDGPKSGWFPNYGIGDVPFFACWATANTNQQT